MTNFRQQMVKSKKKDKAWSRLMQVINQKNLEDFHLPFKESGQVINKLYACGYFKL